MLFLVSFQFHMPTSQKVSPFLKTACLKRVVAQQKGCAYDHFWKTLSVFILKEILWRYSPDVCETKNRIEIKSPSQSMCTLHQACVHYRDNHTNIEISYFILSKQKCLLRWLFLILGRKVIHEKKNISLREKLRLPSDYDVISSGLQKVKWKDHLTSYWFWLWLMTAA